MTVYVNWAWETCKGLFMHNICVMGVEDLPSLTRRPELFVNKFYINFEPLALDCLGAWLDHKEACPVGLDYDLYRQLPRVKERARVGWSKH